MKSPAPTYPCGHPRTPANTHASSSKWRRADGTVGVYVNKHCATCQIRRQKELNARRAPTRAPRGHLAHRGPDQQLREMIKAGKSIHECMAATGLSLSKVYGMRSAMREAGEVFPSAPGGRPRKEEREEAPPDARGGKRCADCSLMLDYRTPREVRLGLPAMAHVCILKARAA